MQHTKTTIQTRFFVYARGLFFNPGKGWALSVYPRCPTDPKGEGLWYNNWCINTAREDIMCALCRL